MNVLELINIGSKQLRERKIATHILDSEILLSRILNESREKVLTNLSQKVSEKKNSYI